MTKKITNESMLKDILKISGAEEVLKKHHFPCITCPMAQMEMNSLKIGQVCNMYGIDADKLIDDLNQLVK